MTSRLSASTTVQLPPAVLAEFKRCAHLMGAPLSGVLRDILIRELPKVRAKAQAMGKAMLEGEPATLPTTPTKRPVRPRA